MALPCPHGSAQLGSPGAAALGWEALCGCGGTCSTGESCSSSAYPEEPNVFKASTGKKKGISNSGAGLGNNSLVSVHASNSKANPKGLQAAQIQERRVFEVPHC